MLPEMDALQKLMAQATVRGKLSTAVNYHVHALTDASHDMPVTLVAWHARNLLELLIWTEYCLQSADNAAQFMIDAIRDIGDMIRVIPKSALEGNEQGRDLLDRFNESRVELAEVIGDGEVNKKYMNVRDAANAIGKLPLYELNMKVLSKWAHPTALAVMMHGQLPPENIASMRLLLKKGALDMAKEASQKGLAHGEEIRQALSKLTESSQEA